MNKKDVATNLAELMRQRGNISENALSRETGIPQPTIHRILTRESLDPKTSTLEPLAAYFGVTVAQVRGEEALPLLGNEISNIQQGPALRRIPLLSWSNIAAWGITGKEPHGEKMVSSSTKMGGDGFAVIVEGNAMTPNFPAGCRLDVDPDAKVKSNDFVIAIPEGFDTAIFRQYVEETGRRLLVPINNSYSVERCERILGRVMSYSMDL